MNALLHTALLLLFAGAGLPAAAVDDPADELPKLAPAAGCWSAGEPPQSVDRHPVGERRFVQVFCHEQSAGNEVYVLYALPAGAPAGLLPPLEFEAFDCRAKVPRMQTVLTGSLSLARNARGEIEVETSHRLDGSGQSGLDYKWLLEPRGGRLIDHYKFEQGGDRIQQRFPCRRPKKQ
ncbi:hypothetical protein [Chitinimonas koreensis]|uniref:hypothetical protein n=1 Tax=Chitinimonas koreensis TaxID=356302 RepID=UPI00040A0A54|nr:hypothetical protein [Chitinimonas koreensis]QNM97781.1 hypothetical protein H9L41_05780 [Chitinimonas koreensis]